MNEWRWVINDWLVGDCQWKLCILLLNTCNGLVNVMQCLHDARNQTGNNGKRTPTLSKMFGWSNQKFVYKWPNFLIDTALTICLVETNQTALPNLFGWFSTKYFCCSVWLMWHLTNVDRNQLVLLTSLTARRGLGNMRFIWMLLDALQYHLPVAKSIGFTIRFC
jgi:hypothetical protein